MPRMNEVWGQPADWVKVYGTEPEGPANTWSLDATIRSPYPNPGFAEPYPPAGLAELLEQKLICGQWHGRGRVVVAPTGPRLPG